MPVEVRELVIKATIVQDLASSEGNGVGQDNGVSPSEELVKVCVDNVLEIIKDNNER